MAPLIIMGVGTAMQMAGNYMSNIAQAQQERLNKEYYDKQAAYVRLAQSRAERLADFDYTQKIGAQVSAYASSGVDMSGSATLTVGGTMSQMIDELWAIKKKGDLDYELANLRGKISGDKADTLASSGYNITQAATIGINSYVGTNGFGTWESAGGGGKLTPAPTSVGSTGTTSYLSGQNLLGSSDYLKGY